jgi:hypothetical protein
MPSLNTGNAILSNAIAVNSSYNVGIGGAASGSYKLQVTGTIAGSGLFSNPADPIAGLVHLKQGSQFEGATGFSAIGATASNQFFFKHGISTNSFFLSSASITTERTYTLPDASGTLALTSNLSAYLPLTGGTLTGALSGTSASFSGSGSFGSAAMSTARLTITDGTSIAAYWKATNTNAATRDWTIITNNNNFGDFAIRQGNSQGADATIGTDRLLISAGGVVGIGITPNTWDGTNVKALQIYNTSLSGSLSWGTALGWNNYHNGGWKYIFTGSAGKYDIGGDEHIWYNAPSGTAGTAISFVERMKITSGGLLAIGVTPAAWDSTILPIEIGNKGGFYAGFNSPAVSVTYMGNNAYYNGGWKIANTSAYRPQLLDCGDGNFHFQNAASGTAGNAITWTSLLKINSNGNVGIGGSDSIVRLNIVGAGATSSTFAMYVTNSTPTALFAVRNDGLTSTGLAANSPYNNTTGAGANAIFANDGTLQRSTSSIKYKTDVRNYDKGLAEVMQLRAVYYKGKNDGDTQYAGLIAEEVDKLGLTEFVQYAEDKTPDAIYYANMVSLLVKAIQELTQKVNEQQQTINSLINR